MHPRQLIQLLIYIINIPFCLFSRTTVCIVQRSECGPTLSVELFGASGKPADPRAAQESWGPRTGATGAAGAAHLSHH